LFGHKSSTLRFSAPSAGWLPARESFVR
jgi:hypothetical protein